MEYPKITIVTPSYNQGKYLEQTILSVLNQNYSNLEYIIIDGGSSDKSVEIIKKYEKYLTYWQSQSDGGQSAAINAGFARATGDIYAWLNSDDYYAEGALKTVGECFADNPECLWLVGKGSFINKKNSVVKIIEPGELTFKSILDYKNAGIFQASTFWRKDLFNKVGNLNESLENAMDVELWLRFAKVINGRRLERMLSFANLHSNMKTEKYTYKTYIEVALILAKYDNFEIAKRLLMRPMKRIFELDRKLRIITRNPIYRKWRDKTQ